MGDHDDAHLRLIGRWLRGEIVNGATGIRLFDGPRAGRIKIVELGADGLPPSGFRTGVVGGDTWLVYALSDQDGEGADHAWTYKFACSQVRIEV